MWRSPETAFVGKVFQAGERPVPQHQGRKERPCRWSKKEAQRERQEAGQNTEASGPVLHAQTRGSSRVT